MHPPKSHLLAHLQPLTDGLASGLIVLDHEGLVRVWNAWIVKYSGVTAADAEGKRLHDVFRGAIEQRLILAVREALDIGLPTLLAHALHPSPLPLYVGDDGDARIAQSVQISPLAGMDERLWCMIQVSDVSRVVQREQLLRKQTRAMSEKVQSLMHAEQQLRQSESRFRELAKNAPVGIFETTLAGEVIFANERWQQMTGVLLGELAYGSWQVVVAVDDREAAIAAWRERASNGERFVMDLRCSHRGSMRKFWVNVDAMPVRDEQGECTGYVGTLVDIHESKESALRSAQQATFDALTGLYNRTPFNERLESALAAAGSAGQLAVLFIDLDGFKQINDERGHEAGDEVLKVIARRLRRTLRADDTIARFGGDEFVILLVAHGSDDDLRATVARIERAVAQPINVGVCHVGVSCSVGYAVYPRDATDAKSLMRVADAQMFTIKAVHRSARPQRESLKSDVIGVPGAELRKDRSGAG